MTEQQLEREQRVSPLEAPASASDPPLRTCAIAAARRGRLATFETSDEPLVLLDDAGSAEFATPRAQRLLTSYGFGVEDVPNVAPLLVRHIHSDVLLLEEHRPLGLTPREREILALVAQGHTNAQIAAALWISPATVGKHLENAYSKLGVTSRTAAVRLIHDHGAARADENRPA